MHCCIRNQCHLSERAPTKHPKKKSLHHPVSCVKEGGLRRGTVNLNVLFALFWLLFPLVLFGPDFMLLFWVLVSVFYQLKNREKAEVERWVTPHGRGDSYTKEHFYHYYYFVLLTCHHNLMRNKIVFGILGLDD